MVKCHTHDVLARVSMRVCMSMHRAVSDEHMREYALPALCVPAEREHDETQHPTPRDSIRFAPEYAYT